jgi:hypothetical protein
VLPRKPGGSGGAGSAVFKTLFPTFSFFQAFGEFSGEKPEPAAPEANAYVFLALIIHHFVTVQTTLVHRASHPGDKQSHYGFEIGRASGI